MRIINYVLLGILVVVLVTVAVANSAPVTLRLLPEAMAGFLGLTWELTLPLFLVIFLGIAVGLLIGFVWEWMREHHYRAEARRQRRERERLEREMTHTPGRPGRKDDEVLALLDDRSTVR
ncbi:LapA family protein [Roseitranquillus sediminis]|uniref:LapA family protein n=1 Tax=Roseitranquillus sediminis TaxID=2809051 RepID=UPI001D0CA616|nr:LapA family protein [Roseitranquillus sediminis]MBM9594897.1 LapA family protein [Roseitranquillus sediminis]